MAAPAGPSTEELPPDWRARLRERLLARPEHRFERCYFGGGTLADFSPELRARLATLLPASPQPAAVLMPIVDHPARPMLLLTVRASHLRRHPGQISFPGGRLEAGEQDPLAAALRETGEELGIAPGFIEPLGFLSDHLVRTGYRVTPVVALVRPGFTLRPEASEVADAFELPLGVALALDNYRAHAHPLREGPLSSYELLYGGRSIWGATAGMLAHLAALLGSTDAAAGGSDA